MDFLNKKVIVTGAARSMGQDMAIAFAKQGADVAISYHHNQTGAEQTVAAIQSAGRRAQAFCADFSDIENVSLFAEQAISFLDGVDILVNNAGVILRGSVLSISHQQLQHAFQINTIAPLFLLQFCAKHMIEHHNSGCAINITSISSCITVPERIGYATSKAAIDKWTRSAASDLAEYGIRVNAVSPGVVGSGMNQDTITTDPTRWAELQRRIPLGRAGVANDITQMVLFLASNQKASWVTGQVFVVDGGRSIPN